MINTQFHATSLVFAKKMKILAVNSDSPYLPWEIIDEILIYVGKEELAVDLGRFAIVRQIGKEADFNWAIRKNKLAYLKYLNQKGLCKDSYSYLGLAVCGARNHYAILKYCRESIRSFVGYTGAFDNAAKYGHLELLEYLHSIGSVRTTYSMDWAAKNGHLKVVKWLHKNREEGCTTRAMDDAAGHGHVLHENRTEGCTEKL